MIQSPHGKVLGLLFLSVLLAGCSGSSSGPKLAPAEGRVIFQNEGVTAGEIYFMPDGEKGNNGTMGSAILQEDGSFKMTTYPKGDGVIPGAYKVTVKLGRRTEKELARFANVKTTPLVIDIPEEGNTDLEFDLSKSYTPSKTKK